MDEDHGSKRAVLRVIGPGLLIVGGLFAIVGFGSFFSSFGSFGGPPGYFWCAFVGLPMVAIGLQITRFAYLGTVTRYVANEVAPVGADAFDYVAEETRDAVRDVASAVGEGIRSGSREGATRRSTEEASVRSCPDCGEPNDSDARFCRSCGRQLAAPKRCGSCGEESAADSRFCDQCGESL